MNKKLCVVFREGYNKNSKEVDDVKKLAHQYGWKLLHEVQQFNDSCPLMLHFLPTKKAIVEQLSGLLYKMDSIKQHSFPLTRSCDG